MTNGCINQASITSGSDITGLAAGTPYWVEVTALAGNGFLASTSTPSFGPDTASSTQIGDPGNPTLSYGGSAGSVNVSFAGSNPAIPGETYSAEACQTNAMTGGTCVNLGTITSGADFGGLAYTAGSAGQNYYVVVTANAIDGFTANPSAVAGPQPDTSQAMAPVITGVGPGSGGQKRLSVTFTKSGSGIASVSALVCSNSNMTGCSTTINYTTGANITVANHAATYYVELTANGSTGYVNSGVSNNVSGTSS
jgi:hypothetical protein